MYPSFYFRKDRLTKSQHSHLRRNGGGGQGGGGHGGGGGGHSGSGGAHGGSQRWDEHRNGIARRSSHEGQKFDISSSPSLHDMPKEAPCP